MREGGRFTRKHDEHRRVKRTKGTNFIKKNIILSSSTSVLLEDNEKRRREGETRRGSCSCMGSYAFHGMVLTPVSNSVTVVDR